MDSKDALIEELRQVVARQAAQIKQLVDRVAQLELELAKAKKDSSTSSKPPSSDIAKPKPKQRPGRPKKRRKGGQSGHQRQLRQPLPAERVDETIDYEIDDSQAKRLGLTPTGDVDVIQHIEMTAEGFHRSMLTHRDRFLELVRQPPATKEAKNLVRGLRSWSIRCGIFGDGSV